MLRIVLGGLVVFAVICTAVYLGRRRGWTQFHQKVIGWTVIGYAAYLASLTSTAWTLVLPGIGPIGAGAATGALIGVGVSAIVGTLGIATGGLAIAVGMGAFATIFGGVGAISGWVATMSSGSYGLRKMTYPLVHWAFWVPIFLVGAYLLWNNRRNPPPPSIPDET